MSSFNYSNPAIMQLYTSNALDSILKTVPNLTFFKKVYVATELFIKDEISLKNIPMKWDDTTFMKIPKDINLLGKVWLTVNIPYFQMVKNITSSSSTITNNSNINEMIFDNHLTYIVISDNTYYLIPVIFLQYPDLIYNYFKLKFSDIKSYFLNLTKIYIADDVDIILYSFDYNYDIIPTLLNLAKPYDKLTLNKIVNGKDRYKQNLLTQNSYDNYITTIIENNLINQFQNINDFDSTIDSSYYNIMAQEFQVLYNNGNINNSDVYLIEKYINDNNISTVNDINIIKKNAISLTSLVYEYIISDLNPFFKKTYAFYKKYSVITTDSIYNFTLNSANIIDVDSLGGNLIQQYYPNYAVNISSLNLPFELATTMTLKTVDNIKVTYVVEDGYNKFKIDDSSTTTDLEKIYMIINTENNTLNEININVDHNDTNSNSEWTTNLLINLGKLDYNNDLEVLLFYLYKKNYYSKENIIRNKLLTFNSNIDAIKQLWIELKVISDRYNLKNSDIGFADDEFVQKTNEVINNYEYILSIETKPMDLFNTFAVIINKFFDSVKKKYYNEYAFLKFFYNKINSFLYQRFVNISELQTLSEFNGLLFYYNIDLLYYITRRLIKDYLLELFNLETYIAYIPISLTPLLLTNNNIVNYTNSTYTNINTSEYFNELKTINEYKFTNTSTQILFTYLNSGNIIRINKELTNYLFYKSNLVEFQVSVLSGIYKFLQIINYSIDDNYLYLTYEDPGFTFNKDEIILNETIKQSIPIVTVENQTIFPDNRIPVQFNTIIVFDKNNGINLFTLYNKLQLTTINIDYIIMKYIKNDIISSYKCTYDSVNRIIIGDLPFDYYTYDTVELIQINLQIQSVNILDSYCNRPIKDSYPYIELLTSSFTTPSSPLFNYIDLFKQFNINTIKTSSGKSVVIDEVLADAIPPYDPILYIYIYDTESYTTNNITLNFFENRTLPNLYKYSSLNTDNLQANDYLLQKPMIIKWKNLYTTDYVENIYTMANIPKMKTAYENNTSQVYINNKPIIRIYNLDGNQLCQTINDDELITKLNSIHYTDNILANAELISDIELITLTEYNNIYEGIYDSIINIIEDSNTEYINAHTEILNYINSGIKLGTTLTNIANNSAKLNKFNLTSNLSLYNVLLDDYNLIDFDSFTPLGLGLYNFTTNNNLVMTTDKTTISKYISKYDKAVTNSPWHNYKPYIKLNPVVINYLDRYNKYSLDMITNLDLNKSALQIVNNENFPQKYINEYEIKGNYYHLICNTNRYNIKLNYPTPWDNYYSNTSSDNIYLTFNKNDQDIYYSTIDSTLYIDSTDVYKYKQIYDKTKYDNMNCYYKLIGAISVVNNTFYTTTTMPNIIVTDDLSVINTTSLPENITCKGINYNCKELEISDTTTVTFNIMPRELYYYKFTCNDMSIFIENINYIIRINGGNGYLKKVGNTMYLLMNILLIPNINMKFIYGIATLTDIYTDYLINNKDVIFINEFVITEYTIIETSIYNYNIASSFITYNKFIINISNNYQRYNDYYIDLNYMFIHLNNITNIVGSLIKVIDDTTPLSPILIDSNVSFYNILDRINRVENKNNWISINNLEIQLKDIGTIIIPDGNYLLYYNDSGLRPTVYKHPDIFRNTNTINNVTFNPFKNTITLPSSTLIDNNSLANNNLINNVTGTLITLEPSYDIIKTNIVLTNGTNYYNRPFAFSNNALNQFDYYLTDPSANPKDSILNVTTSEFNASDIAISKARIYFNTTYTGNFKCNSFLIVIFDLGSYLEILVQREDKTVVKNTFLQIEIINDDYPNKKIIFWVYIGDYINNNLLIDGNMSVEPYYINSIYNFTNNNVSYNFSYADSKYFSKTLTTLTTISTSLITNLTLINNNYLNFDESKQSSYTTITATTLKDKNIKSSLELWSYITFIDSFNTKYINQLNLQQFDYFIFINNNTLYYNEKVKNTDTGIELLYDMDINEADVYVYDYKPIAINCSPNTINIIINFTTAYIYIDQNNLQRNEIIKIGLNVIKVDSWSSYYNCYIGTIIYSSNYINIIDNYYSFGVFTNFLTRNELIKSIDLKNNLFYGKLSNQLNIGDYYIDTNVLKIYTGQTISNYIFKLTEGCNIDLIYTNSKFYYDDTLVLLKQNMRVVYNNNIFTIIQLNGNNIIFDTNPSTNNITVYIPYQPFNSENITITNNTLDIDLYGWIEILGILYRVNNGLLETTIIDGTYSAKIIDINNMNIKHDFNDSIIIENSNQLSITNNYNALKMKCKININESYIYLTNDYSYNFTNLQYCYYSKILINDVWYSIINITSTKLYIDISSDINPFKLTYYDIIISSGNINNNLLVSNKQLLRETNRIDYPKITNTTNSTLTTVFKSNQLDGCFYCFNQNDVVVNNIVNNTMNSNQLFRLLDSFALNNISFIRYCFYQNYIPINLNATTTIYSQIQLNIMNSGKVLLQEITSDNIIFQYYIDISVNNYIISITNTNTFHDIKTSFFYLNNILPCQITKNNNIILLKPEYNIYRPLNVNKNTMTTTVHIKANLISEPVKSLNKWKYKIDILDTNFTMDMVYNKQLFINNIRIPCTLSKIVQGSSNIYYLYVNELIDKISEFYFIDVNYIDEITYNDRTIKTEYENMETSTLDTIVNSSTYTISQCNNPFLLKSSNNIIMQLKDSNNTIVNIGDLDNSTSVGYSNLIHYSTITNTNQYILNTKYNILDVSSEVLYNIMVKFTNILDYYLIDPEISITVPSLEIYLNDQGISINSIINEYKPWKEWTLISTRFNNGMKIYLSNYDLKYDGVNYYQIDSSSYFTDNEITNIKTFEQFMFNYQIGYNIMIELYLVEQYLLDQLCYYITQKYFWNNIIVIIKNIVESYNGIYEWTVENNVIIIKNEFTLYPKNFKLVDNHYIRQNYLSRDYNIIFTNSYITVSRDPSLIPIDPTITNLFGTNMNNVIITLQDYYNTMIQKTTIPINYNYMDSVKYYIGKLYNNITKEQGNNFNTLTNFNRIVKLDSSKKYFGKYFDNMFNTRYFGINGLNQYSYLNSGLNSLDTIYIEANIIEDLYNKPANNNDINTLETNNIFKYNVTFLNPTNQIIESSELIKSSNIYTIDIKDNYNHNIEPVIQNVYINANNLSFDSSKLVQPVDISILCNESYSITNKINYGNIYNITTTDELNENNNLYYNDEKLLLIDYTSTNANICFPSPINNSSNFIKVIDKVVIKKATIQRSNSIGTITLLTFSTNYNNNFNYISINNIIYEILYDNNNYYINEELTIKINELYNVINFITILTYEQTSNYVSDLILDRNINPINYNQVDLTLPMTFSLESITISQIIILTDNSVRITYNTNTVESNIISHNYRLYESIPYNIDTITPLNTYLYNTSNTYKISSTDLMYFDKIQADIISANDLIVFSLSTYKLINDLNNMDMTLIKNYILNIVSYNNETLISLIPGDIVNDNNYYELVDINNNIYTANVTFTTEYLIILTEPNINTKNIKLRQTIILSNHSINEPINNQEYLVTTLNDNTYQNRSSYFMPIIQTLDINLKEFNAKYYYKFNYTNFNYPNYQKDDYIYLVDNYIFIKGIIIMIQSDYVIVGTNNYIEPKTLTIYSSNLSITNSVTIVNTNYIFNKGDFYKQLDDKSYIFTYPLNSINKYNSEENVLTNKVTLIFKYMDVKLYNESYPNVGFNKIPSITTTNTIIEKKYYDINWNQTLAVDLFKSLELSIDDQIIDKIDKDVYTIFGYYFLKKYKREDFFKASIIRKNPDNSITFNIIIPFHFTHYPKQYLPVSNMGKSIVKIKFVLNKLSSLMTNYISESNYTNYVIPSVDINYSFMTLDPKVLSKFDNTTILITPLYYYQNYLLNKPEEYNHISLLNRTIELFFVTKTTNNTQRYTTTIEQDNWYKEYLSNNTIYSYIYNLVDAEIETNSNRYKVMSAHPIISKYNVRLAMYLDSKYLDYIDEDLNNLNLKYSSKLTLLSLYFTNIYKNNIIYNEANIIDYLNIMINGNELLPELPSEYHNYVIPYLKGYMLPKGYHCYGFNYYSLSLQPNGMMNLKKIRDFLIYTKQSDPTNEYILKICTREYKILKIENRKGYLI